MKTIKSFLVSLILTATVLLVQPTASAEPNQSLINSGWYCIYVPANNSPVADWDTYYAVNAWVEWCYGNSFTIWREGDSDGWYWYLRYGWDR